MSTSKITLRDYQARWVETVYSAFKDGWRSVLGVCPTGGGKTVMFAHIMAEHLGAGGAVVHRKEIVAQISMAFAAQGIRHRVIAPKSTVSRIRRKHLRKFGQSFVDPHAECGVLSVQTVVSAASRDNRELQRWLNSITLCVFDEAHHYTQSGYWAKCVESLPNARMLHVTATPKRADGKGLGSHAEGFVDVMIEGPTTRELIKRGFLSSFSYHAPETDLDVSGVAVTKSGDLNTRALRARVVQSHLVGDVVEHYRKFAPGKQAIVFATDVATAGEIAAEFNKWGVRAKALSGETDTAVRDSTIDAFESRELQVLVNVDLFDEGFDVPGVDAVVMARPTESLAKFLQMVGRALRPVYAPGFDLSTTEGRLSAIAAGPKPRAIIIDPVRNWERHGMPDWPRLWTLDSVDKRSRRSADDTEPQRVCLECTQPYRMYLAKCPYCGAPKPEPQGRGAPEQVDGELTELDVEAMAALFERMQAADMSDEDYAKDLIRRNVPRVGRGAAMKRHRAAKYRRQVLRHLIEWWAGAQPHRDTGEIQRRFFHRFGVDVATAMTLNTKDTDALIERLSQRFGEDLRDE